MRIRKPKRSAQSTILGIMTSVVTAFAVVDFDTLNWHLPSTYFKLLVLAIPALNGYLSEIKGKQEPPEHPPIIPN